MKWLLDTNVISERVALQPDRKVMAWMADRHPEDIAISAVTAAELRIGALSAREPRRSQLLDWFEREVDLLFGTRTLPITIEVLVDWLALASRFAQARKTNSAPDTLIAATARVHGLTVVTRNLRDFAGTGTTIYNPWTEKTTQMESM